MTFSSEQTQEIELTVRRLQHEHEKLIQEKLKSEFAENRQFARDVISKTCLLGVFILTAAGAVFFYFYGDSFDKVENRLFKMLDQKVLEYGIDEVWKKQQEKKINLILEGKQFRKNIDDIVMTSVEEQITPAVNESIEAAVQSAVEQVNELGDTKVAELLTRSLDMQVGQHRVGGSKASPGVKVVQVKFPRRFNGVPFIVATTSGDGRYKDSFSVSVRSVSPTGFTANIARTDTAYAHSWEQDLQLNWIAALPRKR